MIHGIQNISFTGHKTALAEKLGAASGEYLSEGVMSIVGKSISAATNGGYIGEGVFFGKLTPQNATARFSTNRFANISSKATESVKDAVPNLGKKLDYIEGYEMGKFGKVNPSEISSPTFVHQNNAETKAWESTTFIG